MSSEGGQTEQAKGRLNALYLNVMCVCVQILPGKDSLNVLHVLCVCVCVPADG